jgi:hypothetical protein
MIFSESGQETDPFEIILVLGMWFVNRDKNG